MSTAFGEDLIQSLNEALAHAKGEGPAIVHAPISPREVRLEAKLNQVRLPDGNAVWTLVQSEES